MSDISDAIDPDEERLVETGAPASQTPLPGEDLPVEVLSDEAGPVPDDDRLADPVADDDLA